MTTIEPRTYRGLAYRQSLTQGAPWIFAFVATAEEVLEWAGIPRRASSELIGFQRVADEARVLKAKDYFSNPNNQSPTSVTLGLHSPTSDSVVFVRGEEVREAGSGIHEATLTIFGDFNNAEPQAVVERIRAYIEARIDLVSASGEGEVPSAESQDEEQFSEEDEDAADLESLEGDEQSGEDDATDVDGIELGTSLLRELEARLEDEAWISENLDVLRDLAKPSTVIDGQHRLLGAQAVERSIPFAICALIDCPWSEQVFQFTVINYTAKGIPDQFITANAALSLTADELSLLEQRLDQAGVKVTEYELMTVVNFNSQSPFFNLVNLAESKKGSEGKIGYKTMVRIARRWYDASLEVVKNELLTNLYPDLPGKKGGARNARLVRWKTQDWGDFFLAFWGEVKKHYDKPELWLPGQSQLMTAIVLFELQQTFLENLGNQDESYFEVSADPDEAKAQLLNKIRTRADKMLEYIPAEFFETEWKTKSLSTGAGRDALQTTLGKLVKTKGAHQWKSTTLVKGAS